MPLLREFVQQNNINSAAATTTILISNALYFTGRCSCGE